MNSSGNGFIESERKQYRIHKNPKLNGNVKKSNFTTGVKSDSMELSL